MMEPGGSQSCPGGGGVEAPTFPLTSREAQPLPPTQVPALEPFLQPRLACVLGLSPSLARGLPASGVCHTHPHDARRDPSTQPPTSGCL